MRWRLSSIRLHSSVVNANILATGAILENPVKELVDLETVIVLNNRAVWKNLTTPD